MSKGKSDIVPAGERTNFDTWVMQMTLEAETTEHDESDFDPRSLFEASLEAGTFEEAVSLLNSGGMKNGKDVVGIVHVIYGYKLRLSDEKYRSQGLQLGCYMIVKAETPGGDDFTYATGSSNIMAIVWQAYKFDRLPLKAVVTSRETANGDLLSLKPSA